MAVRKERPTDASVTGKPCACGYLERAANDPDLPIKFDAVLREYNFWYQVPGDETPSVLLIYHCPFCGGAAPKSLRASLFHEVPRAEMDRLVNRLETIRTLGDALEQLGPPDEDNPRGTTDHCPEEGSRPPLHYACRTLVYRSLSEVAEVRIAQLPDGKVSFAFSGKQIG
jgi:hypothetical protein